MSIMQDLNFTIRRTTVKEVETLSKNMYQVLEVNLLCTSRGDVI